MKISLSEVITQINTELSNDLSSLNSLMANSVSKDVDLIAEIYNYISNHQGKLLRPLLTILSAKLFNYNEGNHIKLAAAIEFIHTATLLHDDVIDESTMRRNYKTVNIVWSNKAAILMGDYLFSKAFQLMVETNNLTVLDILSYSSAVISQGEIKQLENIGNINLSIDTYLDIIATKTAYLFKAATNVGSLIATNNEAEIKAMANFGYNLGLAFQIIDDINDYLADKVKNGKNAGDDLNEGKITLPFILALQKSSSQEHQQLCNIIAKDLKTTEDLNNVISIFNKYKCLEEAKNLANNYLQTAINELDKINTSNPNIKQHLYNLAKVLM
ncbi:polyprenyl synthetase family protein [Rickettsiales bacterium LUAb2]